MTDKYAELRAALDAGPTPGPRSIKEVGDSHRIVVRGGSVSGVMAFIETGWPHPEQQSEQCANALLIAAANPETICALLAEREAQAAEVDRLREAITDYLQAQDAVDNNEHQSMPEDFWKLNGRRNAARDDLDAALSGEPT